MGPTATDSTVSVELEQYGRSPGSLALSGDQRAAIRASKLVDVAEVEPGRYELVASSLVGTAVLPGLNILVRPRFRSMGNVFFLLGYGQGFTKWGAEQFPYETEPDVFKAMAWPFEAEVARALRFGVLRGYEEREELLPTLRGRPDIGAQLREAPGRPYPMACRFVEFLDDTEFNRVIKAAIRRIRRLPGLDRGLAVRLRHHLAAYANVADSFVQPDAPAPLFNRLNEHWRGASILARLILSQRTLVDRHGRVQGITFSVDMNKLFEEFIRAVVGRVARRRGFELAPPKHKPWFSDQVRMQPDLVIRKRTKTPLAVADAKYKKVVPSGDKWSHANLYQLLAYCLAMDLRRGVLIYAESEGEFSVQTTMAIPKDLHTEEISLAGSPKEILARAETVAELLVDQAAVREAELAAA